jgi:uncharacterized protein (TIGR03437 family)
MKLSTRIVIAGIGGLAPMLLYSFSAGPLPRHTGAPGDQTCVQCHFGTALNGGGGGVAVTASTGTTYTPGQSVTFTVTITDAAARVYGFQASARLDSNAEAGQAGSFVPGAQQRVICQDGAEMPAAGCPASGPLQFVEHTSPLQTNTITFNWTAPATDAGPVTIYVAANAANGNGANTGDRIYTTSLKLAAGGGGTGGGATPQIRSGGVVVASNYRAATAAARGGWIEIYGTNLASSTREWAASDFSGSIAPTTLSGVSVTVGGRSAYVAYISPTQVNALAPGDAPVGAGVPVVVKNGSAESEAAMITTADVAPAILAPASFVVGGRQMAVATFAGGSSVTYVGAANAIPGIASRPARAGDVVTLYGIGFGPVSPASEIGTIASGTATTTNAVTVTIGGVPATVQYAGVAPQFVGLYQINVTVPNVPAGDQALVVSVAGAPVAPNVFLTTGQ